MFCASVNKPGAVRASVDYAHLPHLQGSFAPHLGPWLVLPRPGLKHHHVMRVQVFIREKNLIKIKSCVTKIGEIRNIIL